MAWTTPATAVAGTVLTASWLNTYLKDNMLALIGLQWFYIPGSAFHPDLTNGCDAASDATTTAGNPMLSGPSFSGTADKYAQFSYPFPKRWNASTIQYRVRWSSANSGTGSVVFALAARAATDDDTIDGSFGTAVNVTDTFLAAKDHHQSPLSSSLTVGNSPSKEDMVYFRFGRLATNGSDTKTDAVTVEGVEIFLLPDTANDA